MRLGAGDPAAPGLALVAGVALHETARLWAGGAGDGLRIKWPNDLMAGEAKLAGILLERSGDAVVIGFGVNLASAPGVPGRVTGNLSALTEAAPDPALFLADLARAVSLWLSRWRAEGLAPVRRAWLERAHAVGSALAAQGGDGVRREGLFEGLDADGALLLRLADGGLETIRAGDIFLI